MPASTEDQSLTTSLAEPHVSLSTRLFEVDDYLLTTPLAILAEKVALSKLVTVTPIEDPVHMEIS